MSRVWRFLVYSMLGVMLAMNGVAAFRLTEDRAGTSKTEERLVATSGLLANATKGLASEYSDKNGRLLADPPTDETKLLDPDHLVLAHQVDTESETSPVDWQGLQASLSNAAGLQVDLCEYANTVTEVAAVKEGQIHLVALHSADTPYLVDYAGFIPCGVLGTEAGPQGNRLDIAVPANSKIHKLADLKGHQLTCTRPDSITGYRAAIASLLQEAGIRPYVDYSIIWSFGQSESIHGVVSGKYEIAALSDDKLQAFLKKGRIKKSDLRIIYQSPVIPHLVIGHLYNLRPQLTAKIIAAILKFQNQQGTVDESTGKPMRFLPVNYKKDFAFARKIDEPFDPRFHQRVRPDPPRDPAETPSDGVTDGPATTPQAARLRPRF